MYNDHEERGMLPLSIVIKWIRSTPLFTKDSKLLIYLYLCLGAITVLASILAWVWTADRVGTGYQVEGNSFSIAQGVPGLLTEILEMSMLYLLFVVFALMEYTRPPVVIRGLFLGLSVFLTVWFIHDAYSDYRFNAFLGISTSIFIGGAA